MKFFLMIIIVMITQSYSYAASNVSVKIDGITYTCSQDGSGGGGGSQVICICDRFFTGRDFVYILKQSTNGGVSYSELQRFYGDNGLSDCGKMRKQVCD
jgi:hypothetical protein